MTAGVRQAPPRTPLRSLDPVLALVLAATAYLLLANLGETWLWTDEAEAACLGRSILREGVPTAFDGRNYLSQWVVAKREDFDDDLVWVLSPWLQLYVCAGSFALLGVTTLAARLPFALVGILDVLAIHALALRATGDRRVARVAAALLGTCIPFLLHARQARYYTFAVLATLWAVHAYLGILQRKPRSALWLVLAVALLFHSNYGLCVPLVLGLALHALVFAWRRATWKQVLLVPLGIGALTLPWALFARIHRTAARLDLEPYFYNLFTYLFAVNRWALPLPLAAAALVLALLGWRSGRVRLATPALAAVLLPAAVGVAFVSTNVGVFTRYVINVIPLFVVLCAALAVWLADGAQAKLGRAAGAGAWCLVPLLMLTTVLSMPAAPLLADAAMAAPHKAFQDSPAVRRPFEDFYGPRHELLDLWGELHRPYDGPLEGVARFLLEHAEPGQTLYIDYGDLPLLFYTDLLVRGGLQGAPWHGRPEWIVLRSNRVGIAVNDLVEFAAREGYVAYRLENPDTRWENRPDPFAHFYRTPPSGAVPRLTEGGVYPGIVILKRPDVPLRGEEPR